MAKIAGRFDPEAPLVEWAVAERALPGQPVSGDRHLVQSFRGGVLIAAIDGLGHGHDAATAADLAVETLRKEPKAPVEQLFERCHAALRETRGVVMTVVSVDGYHDSLTWGGVGNVEAMLIRAVPVNGVARQVIVQRNGVVGYGALSPRPTVLHIARGDLLVLATDGIRAGFADAVMADAAPAATAEAILAGFARDADDALVLVGRYLRGGM